MVGNSSAGGLLCLAFLPLGICGCSIPVVVAGWLFCLHPALGEMWRSYSEQVGAEVDVELLGLLGSAVPRLGFSTALGAPSSSWCTAPCSPGHGIIPLDFFCRPWRTKRLWECIIQMIQAWVLCF